ncbi:MAG: signal peptidase II [Alphaproteobacteria bacterium]|nr:signal peptidase II [Alphaproteobacteria bacterium]
MSVLTRNRLAGLVIAAVIFLVDQAVKRWVVFDLGLRQRGDQIEVLPFFNLTRENNYGVSLGMFAADSLEMRWALVALTGAIALFVAVWMMREKAMADVVALALILGGALGNIRDRFYHGFVIDYADLHFGDFRPFLIFNVADAAITIGVLIILARTLLSREKPETPTETPASES